jgi:hypothetical protein
MKHAMARHVGLLAAASGIAAIVACTPAENAQIPLTAPLAPGQCTEWIGQPVDRTCLPRMAMANRPLLLEMEERCGTCGTTAERCTVTVEGRTITLSLDGKACEPAAGTACRDACSKNRVKCKIAPLAEGHYKVRYGDTSGRTDHIDVMSEGATACMLDDPAPGG